MIKPALVVLFLVFAQAALASTIADAERAYLQGDYALAAELFLPFAENGDLSAQYNLGVILEDHLGDYERALYWTRAAANRGDADAQIRLASMYQNGVGTAVDHELALGYFRLSAEQGNVHGQANLAHMYLNGDGVQQDFAQGIVWLIKAADNGHAHAQYLLGAMLTSGDRLARDDEKAEYYLQKAAEQGHDDALALLDSE